MKKKSPIKQKILLYLAQRGVSAYEFYKLSGVTRGILQQDNGISEDNIARFLAYAPDVSAEWLLTGQGPILKTPQATAAEAHSKALASSSQNPPTGATPLYGEGEMLKGDAAVSDAGERYAAGLSGEIVQLLNSRQLAPYAMLEDKERQIAELNREIGRLEAQLEAAQKGAVHRGGNVAVADAG